MSGGSIILEPKQMFQTLNEMEKATQDVLKLIQEVSQVLEAASILTFAIGFGELIQAAVAGLTRWVTRSWRLTTPSTAPARTWSTS